ncbi:MAG: hypothetical protein KDK37_17005 [Leptospiraceae bacterium]|nr:hypothetical protein [Leptospiraceae bacterium]
MIGESTKAMLPSSRWNTIYFPLLLTVLAASILSCYGSRNSEGVEALVLPAAGHEHQIRIRWAQIESGLRTFTLEETAGHTHSITLTEEMVQTVKNGGVVRVDSTVEQYHYHTVQIEHFY